MTVLNAAQVAQLVKQVGFPANVHVEMVAISKAESSFRTDAVGGPNRNQTYDRGLWQINDVHRFDRNRLVRDGKYNAECAKNVFVRQGLRAWSVYNSGAWRKHENEARQGVAQSAAVVGTPEVVGNSGAQGKPAVTYGPPGPQITVAGVGAPLAAGMPVPGPLQGLRIIGTEIEGDFSTVVIGNSKYTAGWDTVPNLNFTIADPEGGMLWFHQGIWQRGARVAWQDLDMRIDEITFSPGGHTTGQLEISAIDSIVYGLMNLRGERVASGISAVQWLAQEMQLCGFDPNRYLLGEAVPTQSEIARDIPDPEGQAGNSEAPSAWTTIVRLAKELGKRVFISGSRIVFGSVAFAMQWSAPGDLHIGWHSMQPGERWQTMPTGKQTSIANRSGLTEVSGRVPLNRAGFFRPGVSVLVRHTPSIAAAENRSFMVSKIEHDIANDIDGADVTLNEPVDPPPQPPTSNEKVNDGATGNGEQVSGGGADGQVDQFVNLCLRQVGDRYVFGAETSMSDPDPKVFDCCLTIDSMISTSSRGPVPIAEVEPGDQVWTWDEGTLAERKVVAVAEQPVQPVFAVRTRNSCVRASANHPFLTLQRDKRERDERGAWVPVTWRAQWTRVDELKRGDLLVSLERAPLAGRPAALPDGTVINTDVAWLLGEIIGDGHVHDSGVSIAAFRPAVRQRIREIVRQYWGAVGADHPTAGVIVPSVHLRDVLTELGMRVRAHDKRVPDLIRTLPAGPSRAFLAGYAEADGHLDKRGHQSYHSCSRRLVEDVRALHRRLGDRVSNITVTKRTRPITINGKLVRHARDLHLFAAYPNSTRRNSTILDIYGARRAIPDRSFNVERITSIKPDGVEPTFDLEIEGSHNYISDGIVAHNSELIEWAASRVGISPRVPDGSSAQINHCRSIPVDQAIRTKGALLWHSGHIAISLGNGRTVEAQNPKAGVVQANAGNRFKRGGLIPGAKGYR